MGLNRGGSILKVLNRSRQEDQQRYVQAKSDLSTKLEQNKRMQETSTKLAADNKQLREELEKMKASKDADENAFAEQLVDLQKKINDTQARMHQIDSMRSIFKFVTKLQFYFFAIVEGFGVRSNSG